MIDLSQAAYIDKVQVRFTMQDSKKGITPFRHEMHISKDQYLKSHKEKEQMRAEPYTSAVGRHICYALY